MSFLKRLFRLDAQSHVDRGDGYAQSGEWGLAHLEYEKALLAVEEGESPAAEEIEEKKAQAVEQIHERNLTRAAEAERASDLSEAIDFLESVRDMLPEGDGRLPDLEKRVEELRRRRDEASLKQEIAAFLSDQGTAQLVARRRHWEFSLYLVNPSDVDLDDSFKYTTLELIEKAAALDDNPDDPERLIDLGMALARTGYTRRAIAPLRRAAELKPDDKEVHYVLGNLLADEGDLDRAVARFEKALALDPGFSLAYLYLGRTYIRAEDDEEAERFLSKAVETAADDSGIAEEAAELLAEVQARKQQSVTEVPDSLEDRIP